jgi:hypothetical protein
MKPFLLSLFSFLSLSWFCFSAKSSESVIKIEVIYMEAGNASSLEDAQVICFDEQPGESGMSVLTDTVKTNRNGKAVLKYKYNVEERNDKPDIYCKIEKENVFTVSVVYIVRTLWHFVYRYFMLFPPLPCRPLRGHLQTTIPNTLLTSER